MVPGSEPPLVFDPLPPALDEPSTDEDLKDLIGNLLLIKVDLNGLPGLVTNMRGDLLSSNDKLGRVLWNDQWLGRWLRLWDGTLLGKLIWWGRWVELGSVEELPRDVVRLASETDGTLSVDSFVKDGPLNLVVALTSTSTLGSTGGPSSSHDTHTSDEPLTPANVSESDGSALGDIGSLADSGRNVSSGRLKDPTVGGWGVAEGVKLMGTSLAFNRSMLQDLEGLAVGAEGGGEEVDWLIGLVSGVNGGVGADGEGHLPVGTGLGGGVVSRVAVEAVPVVASGHGVHRRTPNIH